MELHRSDPIGLDGVVVAGKEGLSYRGRRRGRSLGVVLAAAGHGPKMGGPRHDLRTDKRPRHEERSRRGRQPFGFLRGK